MCWRYPVSHFFDIFLIITHLNLNFNTIPIQIITQKISDTFHCPRKNLNIWSKFHRETKFKALAMACRLGEPHPNENLTPLFTKTGAGTANSETSVGKNLTTNAGSPALCAENRNREEVQTPRILRSWCKKKRGTMYTCREHAPENFDWTRLLDNLPSCPENDRSPCQFPGKNDKNPRGWIK